MTRLQDLRDLTTHPDWDDEGAVAISSAQWDHAYGLASTVKILVPSSPEAFYSASGDGSIHLRWAVEDRYLDVEIDECSVYYWMTRVEGRARTRHRQSDFGLDVVDAVRALFK